MSKKTIVGKRINFATSKILEYPDLLEVQLKSFRDFFQLETSPENRKNEGLYRYSRRFSPSKIRATATSWSSSTTSSILRSIQLKSVLREG